MPIYEYECQACGHKLEVLQRMGEAPLKTCPDCNRDELRKLVSAAGFQLKGTGWYETDFKNKGRPASGKDGGDAKPAGDGAKDAAGGEKVGKDGDKTPTKADAGTAGD